MEIDETYKIFRRKRPSLDEHWFGADLRARLKQAKLREVCARDLDDVFTVTAGCGNDRAVLRYYLPRVLELLRSGTSHVGSCELTWALIHDGYDSWPDPERRAVHAALFEAWTRRLIVQGPFAPTRILEDFGVLILEITPFVAALDRLEDPRCAAAVIGAVDGLLRLLDPDDIGRTTCPTPRMMLKVRAWLCRAEILGRVRRLAAGLRGCDGEWAKATVWDLELAVAKIKRDPGGSSAAPAERIVERSGPRAPSGRRPPSIVSRGR